VSGRGRAGRRSRGTLPGRPLMALRAAALLAALLAAVPALPADRTEKAPPELDGVGVTEYRAAPLPLDRAFVDEEGRPVRLGDFFDGRRPVILNLGYYGCPMLCGLVANGLAAGMKRLEWSPGAEYQVVTLSINPAETPALAKAKKQNYIKELGRPSSAGGWRFLTGREEDIRAVTDAVGFGYRWVEETRQFAHAAVIVICTPDGRVSRYLYGIEFDPQTLRLSLVEAAKGKIGSPLDQILLFCFHYDAREGRYALAAAQLMRLGGAVTAMALAAFLLAMWRRDMRRRGVS
jgi:protein SCO1